MGFDSNTWRVAAEDWFQGFQTDTESHVLGRIVETRQSGIFSYGGLTGWGNTESCPQGGCIGYPQYQAFLQDTRLTSFFPYLSQTGGQAMLFGVLDQALRIPSPAKLALFHGITSLLSALTLALIVLWFDLEFGLVAALFVLGSAVLSQWLTVFGRNLWWSIWAFYAPMVSVAFYLRRLARPPRWFSFGLVVFAAVVLKCMINGFEYITTTLLMSLVPLVYYALARRWSLRATAAGLLAAGAASLAAVLVSAAILSLQIAAVEGSFADGLNQILFALGKRTYGDPALFPQDYRASLQASLPDVMVPYLMGWFFNLNNWLIVPSAFVTRYLFKIRYFYLIGLFFVAGFLLWLGERRVRSDSSGRRNLALVWATWLSLLAPLSWFVIFKAHSSIHTHINFLVWQMPYTLFGFGLTGVAARRIVERLGVQLRRRGSAAQLPASPPSPRQG
jgi:hypothetical protein